MKLSKEDYILEEKQLLASNEESRVKEKRLSELRILIDSFIQQQKIMILTKKCRAYEELLKKHNINYLR